MHLVFKYVLKFLYIYLLMNTHTDKVVLRYLKNKKGIFIFRKKVKQYHKKKFTHHSRNTVL